MRIRQHGRQSAGDLASMGIQPETGAQKIVSTEASQHEVSQQDHSRENGAAPAQRGHGS